MDFVGAFLQARTRNRIFVKLPAKYGELYSEFSQYCGRALRLLRSMYGTTTAGKDWDDDLHDWLTIEAKFVQSAVNGALYWHVNDDGTVLRLLNYIDNQAYYAATLDVVAGKIGNETKSEHCKHKAQGKAAEEAFPDEIAARFNVNIFGNIHWFLSI